MVEKKKAKCETKERKSRPKRNTNSKLCKENQRDVPDVPGSSKEKRIISKSDWNSLFNILAIERGCSSSICREKLARGLVNKNISKFEDANFNTESTICSERITAMDWHFKYPYTLVYGNKHGQILLKDMNKMTVTQIKEPIGAGCSICAVKFNHLDADNLYIASMEAHVLKLNVVTSAQSTLLHTANPYVEWYVSLDLNQDKGLICVGDTIGNLKFVAQDGTLAAQYKIHKNTKIASLEFSKRDPNIVCTASNDKVVRLWDIRFIDRLKPKPLTSLAHEYPINRATFSRTDGCRLMTTDQRETINIYKAPSFQLENSIKHPHRFFQYITPIRASWHPLADLITIGRYPEQNTDDLRSVDIIDPTTGNVVIEFVERHVQKPNIKSICEWNIDGSVLAATSARNLVTWKADTSLLF